MQDFSLSQNDIFAALFNSVSEGIIVVNEAEQIVSTNKSTLEMFGYTKEELENAPLGTLIPMQFRSGHHGHFKSFLNQKEKRSMGKGRDLYGLKKNGDQFPVEAGLNPFFINDKVYVIALIIDISERKKQEQEIVELNSQLELKIEQRTQELKLSVQELKQEVSRRKEAEEKITEALRVERELNELKTKFLSLVSHEFKTPLSGIMTSSMLISKYTKTEQQDKREKHIKTIQGKVKYLNNILSDFLSLERLQTGKENYTLNSFPVSTVVNEVIYDANLLLKEGQQIVYPDSVADTIIEFDQRILTLCLSNVLHNSIKYSGEHTEITIDGKVESPFMKISITDQGIGIPKEEQKHIFNRYFRAENAILVQGTGIGLNIVQGHLENLGGKIEFVSEHNRGTTFTLTIPLKAKI